jgi:polyvinyl alcohol dehydrogenase (cytochrome)
MIAVNAKTGEIVWKDQAYQQDVWVKDRPEGPDWDFSAAPQLFEANGRELVGIGSKSGVYFAYDRATGDLVWKTAVGFGAIGGGIRWDGSVGDGRILISSNNRYKDKNPAKFPISVQALDAATGQRVWWHDKPQPAKGTNAGYLANDVYIDGSLTGDIKAYRASDGKVLAHFKAPGAVASSLNVRGDTLFFGGGVPKAFGGQPEGNGMFAYAVGGKVNLDQQADMPRTGGEQDGTMPEQMPTTGGGGMAGDVLPLGNIATAASLAVATGYGLVKYRRQN